MKVVLMATIRLFKNIPWSQGGFHVLRFQNNSTQAAFFNGLESLEFTDIDYEPRPGANLNLDIPLMEARQYNYLSWEDENNGPLYYFIEDYEYLNDYPTTRFTISEDIWQNNHLRISGIYGAVHRRHMPRWDGNIPLLYPIDEGNVRSKTVYKKVRIDDYGKIVPGRDLFAFIIATSKDPVLGDTINYYITASYKDGVGAPAPSGKRWLSPFNDGFIKFFADKNIPPSAIVGVWMVPVARNIVTYSNNAVNIRGVLLSDETFQIAVFAQSILTIQPV